MKKKIWAVILIVLLSSCITYRLEKRLSPQIKEQYNYLSIIMTAPIPEWLGLPRYIKTEKDLFLRASPEAQAKYIENFWNYHPDSKEYWEERLSWARLFLENAGEKLYQNIRCRYVLMFGYPDYIHDIHLEDLEAKEGETFSIEGIVYQRWIYYLSTAEIVSFTFKFYSTGWQLVMFEGNIHQLYRERTSIFWPIYDDEWEAIVKVLWQK